MIEVLIVFIVILIINDELTVDIYSSCTFRSYYSFHSFVIQLIQVPLVAISHRMARLVIIGADDEINYTDSTAGARS
jgi:phage-related holin